jgi:hypothetical protein
VVSNRLRETHPLERTCPQFLGLPLWCRNKGDQLYYSREIFFNNSVVDLPGTIGMIITLPPAFSTVRRSSWFSDSTV